MSSTVSGFMKQGQDFADKASRQARVAGKRSLNVVSDAAQQALDTASDATDSALAYTRKNPGRALLLAAASGVILAALVKALAPSRDS